jgi:uracil-DNA glycosylase
MQITECVGCKSFPCLDVNHAVYIVPEIDIDPQKVSLVLISEAAPENHGAYYYAPGSPMFQQTTLQAFNFANAEVDSFQDLLDKGIYFTTAVKCGKTGYGIKTATIKECSLILEKELSLFQNVKAFLLMGDVAIKAINYIAIRAGDGRSIPAGSTYKIRGGKFYFRGVRAFPSYLQVGPSFGIEKSKQKMIGEDIAAALAML